MWKDRKFAPQAAEALQITAKKLLELGIADAIVSEPAGGAHRDLDKAAELLGKELDRQLTQLSSMSEQELKDQRYDKFRAFGCFETATVQPDLLENIDEDAE